MDFNTEANKIQAAVEYKNQVFLRSLLEKYAAFSSPNECLKKRLIREILKEIYIAVEIDNYCNSKDRYIKNKLNLSLDGDKSYWTTLDLVEYVMSDPNQKALCYLATKQEITNEFVKTGSIESLDLIFNSLFDDSEMEVAGDRPHRTMLSGVGDPMLYRHCLTIDANMLINHTDLDYQQVNKLVQDPVKFTALCEHIENYLNESFVLGGGINLALDCLD